MKLRLGFAILALTTIPAGLSSCGKQQSQSQSNATTELRKPLEPLQKQASEGTSNAPSESQQQKRPQKKQPKTKMPRVDSQHPSAAAKVVAPVRPDLTAAPRQAQAGQAAQAEPQKSVTKRAIPVDVNNPAGSAQNETPPVPPGETVPEPAEAVARANQQQQMDSGPLQEQLAAQYKPAKIGSGAGGYSVAETGTLLAIQKGGILGVPYSDQSILSTKYEGGIIHSPNVLVAKGIGFGLGKFGKEQTTHLFQVGDEVYVTKIDLNLTRDSVALTIVACDPCNKTDSSTFNKAQVVFQFPKGYLARASAGDVEDVIGQVLATRTDDAQHGGQEQRAAQGQQQAEPAAVQLGQTVDQVQADLGKPEKIVNLGAKQIYVYKDLKVTFVNGKVVDVQ